MNSSEKKRYNGLQARYRFVALLVALLMIALAARMFLLTVVQGDEWENAASEQYTKTIYTSAARGRIYDRNGNLLAGNKQIFTATFNASNLTTEQINESALTLINKLIENGDEYIDDFPIVISSDGQFSYTYDTDLAAWLTANGFDIGTSAETVFDVTCSKYGIAEGTDRFEAEKTLSEKHNVELPINVKRMRFNYDLQKDSFLSKFGFSDDDIKKGITAEDAFHQLREDYSVDPSLADAEARKIFIVRNKVAEGSFQRYIPITIGKDLCDESVIYFEEAAIPGVSVASELQRYYPYNNSACHIIGYMGAISDSESEYYVDERGYLATDMVGKDGIEAALEEKLHGTPGIETVIVDSSGNYVSTIDKTESSKGSDVYLTVDMDLQQVVESTLKQAVSEIETAGSGAMVVLDVATSDVLALASYPDFDLNMFADGISAAEWESVQPANPRDPFSPTPLYNNATMAAIAPGSTFKPLTAITAIEHGLDPDHYILDRGYIELGGRRFACATWNRYGGTDGYENLEIGMGMSCNYYFACIATAYDWGTGESLGYSISIDDILNRAQDFGLGKASGIELYETVRSPVSLDSKIENYRYAVWSALYENARTYFPPEVYGDYDRLSENISKIANWIYDNPSYSDLIDLIRNETEVLDDEVESCAEMVKFDYFNQAEWGTFDVFNVSIGQGDNCYTPVQVARYIATIGNHGQRNDVSLVYGVEGEGLNEKAEPYDTGLSESTREDVLNGMKKVIDYNPYMSSYPIECAGKTGTAQYQAIKQPADEAEYVKEHLSQINSAAGSSVTWEQVEAKIKELMISDANTYPTENDTVDDALIEVSDYKVTYSIINSYKDSYEDFTWMVLLAPADEPKIAIALMIPEGEMSYTLGQYMAPVLDEYFKTEAPTYASTADNGTNAAVE